MIFHDAQQSSIIQIPCRIAVSNQIFSIFSPGIQMNIKNLIPPQVNPINNPTLRSQLEEAQKNNSQINANQEIKSQVDLAQASNAEKKSEIKQQPNQENQEQQEASYEEGLEQYEYEETSYYDDSEQEEDEEEDQYEDSSEYEEENADVVSELPAPSGPGENPDAPSIKNPSSRPASSIKASQMSQLVDDEFDKQKLDRMYKFPASYKQAMIHNMASKFGFNNAKIKKDDKEETELKDILASFIKNQKMPKENTTAKKIIEEKELEKKLMKYEKVPICPCCQNLISNVQIPLCYPTEPPRPKQGNPKFLLQTGVTMYFVFVKAVILYLVFRLLILDIVNIYLSIYGHYCSSVQKTTDTCSYTTTSGYNLNTLEDVQALNILDYCNLGLTIVSIIYFTMYRKKQARLINWLDRNSKSQKDFSILIEDIPLFIYEEGMVKTDVDYKYEGILKEQIEIIIRQWLQSIVKINKDSPEFQDLDYYEQHYHRFVFQRKIADEKEQAEERKKNPKPVINKRKKLPEFNNDQDIKNYVKNIIVKRQRIVASVTLCYDLTQLETMNTIRDQLVAAYIEQNEGKIIDANDPEIKDNQLLEHIPNQIDQLNQQYTNLCNKLATDSSPAFSLSHFTGKAIVSFQYKHYRDYLLREYAQNGGILKLNNKSLKISLTNKPEDIFWYNMKVSDSDRSRFIFYSYAILFMLLILSFASLIGLQYWQSHTQLPVDSTNILDKIKSNMFSFGMAIMTNVINSILSYSITLLADMERHKTKSDHLNSLVIKIIVTQTINTSFIYFILYLISPSNPLGKAGLVKNVFDLVLVSGFISVVQQIFPLGYLLTKLKNKYRYEDKQQINMFQVQLNQILQQPEFNFAVMYGFYIVFTFVVSFYGFIAPTATPVLIFIFIIQYWVDKYNLFKRYSCPVDFGAELIKKIFIMFQTSLLISVVGHFVWDFKIHKDQSPQIRIVSIANLVIASLFVFFELFATDRLKRKFFDFEEEQCDPYSYTSYQRDDAFKKTYFRENPATACLKQTKLNNGKRKNAKKVEEEVVYEAPDPQFIPPHEKIFQKFLELEEKRKILGIYTSLDEEYYDNFEKDDWDEVAAEQNFIEREKNKKKVKKDGYLDFNIPGLNNAEPKKP